jgi:hypothetical protein
LQNNAKDTVLLHPFFWASFIGVGNMDSIQWKTYRLYLAVPLMQGSIYKLCWFKKIGGTGHLF